MDQVPSEAIDLAELQSSLEHLYDPVQLAKSSLLGRLTVGGQVGEPDTLRNLLIDTIDELSPDESIPPHSNLARYYHLLYERYVEQYAQQEVAADLGLSVRQLRRVEKAALELLAQRLADRFPQPVGAGKFSRPVGEAVAATSDGTSTPSRSEELAWSRKAIPSEAVHVASLLHSVIDTLAPLAEQLDVAVVCDLPEPLPQLEIQAVTLRQALLSVLSAAVRRAPGGRVAVDASAVANVVAVNVRATDGRGAALAWVKIDSEDLTMARDLIELSGGQLTPESERNTKLPDGEQQPSPVVSILLPSARVWTVLAVDDNPDTLQLLMRYVAGTPYTLVGIQDPHRLLAAAEEARPDVIILDVMMPDIDGWELLGRLRADPSLGEIPIVVATILPHEQLAYALGASGFIRKPVARDSFIEVLDMQVRSLWG